MSGEWELGSLGLALFILCILLGSLFLLAATGAVFYFLTGAQRRRLDKTLKHCGLEDYYAKTQKSVKEYGYLQRAPYDITGIDVQDGVSDDSDFLQMIRDLRQINRNAREKERAKADDYWGAR